MCSFASVHPTRNPHSEMLSSLDVNNTSNSAATRLPTDFPFRIAKEEGDVANLLTLIHNLTLTKLENLTLDARYMQREYYPDFSQIGIVRGLFVCLFLFELLIGVVGNILVCVTVYRNKSMHSAVNYGIVNLAFCDFLVGGFVLPTKLFELTAPVDINVMTDLWCTVIRFLESVIVFVSVFTLVAICIERYYAVVFPMHSRIHMTSYRIRKILLLVWIIPIIVASPNLYPAIAAKHYLYSEYGEFTRLTCSDMFTDQFRLWYFLFLFCFMYLIPLLFIGTTCFSITRVLMKKIPIQPRRDPRAISLEDGRRKVAKMVLVVVAAFLVCWSPYFLVSVISQLQAENFMHNRQFFFTMLCINLCCFTNSCINPFVYFSMSKRFRTGFLGIFHSLSICSTERGYSPDIQTRSLTSQRQSHRGVLSQGPMDHRYMVNPSSPRAVHCSCQAGNVRSMSRQTTASDTASISYGTPKSTGNSQGQTVSYHRHGIPNSGHGHTIVFEFHQLPQSPCESSGLEVTPFTPPPAYQESSFLL